MPWQWVTPNSHEHQSYGVVRDAAREMGEGMHSTLLVVEFNHTGVIDHGTAINPFYFSDMFWDSGHNSGVESDEVRIWTHAAFELVHPDNDLDVHDAYWHQQTRNVVLADDLRLNAGVPSPGGRAPFNATNGTFTLTAAEAMEAAMARADDGRRRNPWWGGED